MQRIVSIVLLAVLLAACAGPVATNAPTTAALPPTTGAQRATAAPPTAAPATVAPATSAATSAPTSAAPPTAVPATVAPPTTVPATTAPAPTAAATARPDTTALPMAAEATAILTDTTALPAATDAATAVLTDATALPAATEPPTALPTVAPAAFTPLDPQAQAAALLPDSAGDLSRASSWNRYTINAAIDTNRRTLAGHQQLEYTNRDSVALDRLYFHLFPNLRDFGGTLAVGALTIDGQPQDVVYESQRYLLRVNLPQPLAPGASTVVAFDFTTSAPLNAAQNRYGAFNKQDGVLALASAYPIVAVVRGGAWDIGRPDPQGDFVDSETALYDVTLRAPADWPLVTTGVTIEQRQDGDQQIARIVSGPQRDFTIMATQLQQLSADVAGTRVTSYFRAAHAAGGKIALQTAIDALQAFNKRYGRYPLRELDVVEITGSSFLGVEYPGLVMIEQSVYGGGGELETTVAHEVAHQWWYSLVGNSTINESWLDEALASYAQVVYEEEVHGADAAERELDGFRQRYRNVLANGRDAAVARPTSAFRGNYVGLVYGKSVLFFAAMRKQIGDEAFDRFWHQYYADHRYGYIIGSDLLASAEGACSCDLHPLYASWITEVVPLEVP